MDENQRLTNELKNIKQMMERSSRFISLSGLSGIAAGVCALVGAYVAGSIMNKQADINLQQFTKPQRSFVYSDFLNSRLLQVALITFISSFLLAFIFTYRRSKKTNVPVWGTMAKRVMISVSVPMAAGGIFILALIKNGVYDFVAPCCLVFYGLGVLNASKYTLAETKYLGYFEILLGLINLYFLKDGLYFWAAGFGLLHIIYGVFMWWKYEMNS